MKVAQRSTARSLLPWIASILIALIFLSEGAAKFSERGVWLRIFEQIGLGHWFRYFTGVVEITGALLLIVPATRLLGAVLLACTMCGALLTHALVTGFGRPTVAVIVLLLVLVAIAADRLRKRRSHQPASSERLPV